MENIDTKVETATASHVEEHSEEQQIEKVDFMIMVGDKVLYNFEDSILKSNDEQQSQEQQIDEEPKKRRTRR